jgi:large subunit ribosomal protein L18
MVVKKYKNQRDKRRVRIRGKIKGTEKRPRLSVFRSHQHIYAQLIDDVKGETLAAAMGGADVAAAGKVGKILAASALKLGIKKVVFDRGGYKYHGRVKALADGAREGGLEF